MRGEKKLSRSSLRSVIGSPPHARGKAIAGILHGQVAGITPACAGKVVDLRLHVGHAGITPACAGKSSPARIPPCRRRDHPRVCGEKLTQPSAGGWWLGSPPRVRGKEVFPYRVQHPGGITPACAGKSRCTACAGCAPEDHPRVCREKCKYRLRFFAFQGSPPRVRGKD